MCSCAETSCNPSLTFPGVELLCCWIHQASASLGLGHELHMVSAKERYAFLEGTVLGVITFLGKDVAY